MSADASLAIKYYADEMSYTRSLDEDDITYAWVTSLKEFPAHALEATLDLIGEDAKRQYVVLLENGVTESDDMFPVALEGAEGLALRLPSGTNVLLCWWTEENASCFGVVPWIPPVPKDLIDRAEAVIAAEEASPEKLNDIADELARHGGLPIPVCDRYYTDIPLSLADLQDLVVDKGPARICRGKGIGHTTLTDRRGTTRSRAYVGAIAGIAILNELSEIFELRSEREDDHILGMDTEVVVSAIRAGELSALHRSLTALAIGRQLEAAAEDLRDIVEIGEDIGLTRWTNLTSGDLDMVLGIARLPDAVALVHNNQSLNEGNVFVTVLKDWDGSSASSVDVYLARAWYKKGAESDEVRDFDRNGKPMDGPIDLEGLYALARNRSELRHKMDEDALIDALSTGEAVELGKVLSYDAATKTIDLYPASERTGFTTHLEDMLNYDADALRGLHSGDRDDCHIGVRPIGATDAMEEDTISANEYLQGRGVSRTAP